MKHKKSEPFKLYLKKCNYREDKLPKLYDILMFPNNRDKGVVMKIEEVTWYQETTIICTIYYIKESKYKLINKIKILWLKILILQKKITLKLTSMIRNVFA